MVAKLATVDEHISAHSEGSGTIPYGCICSSRANETPLAAGMRFDCGYLLPSFITDPERMEAAFEKVYILLHRGKITSRNDLAPCLSSSRTTANPCLSSQRMLKAKHWLLSS